MRSPPRAGVDFVPQKDSRGTRRVEAGAAPSSRLQAPAHRKAAKSRVLSQRTLKALRSGRFSSMAPSRGMLSNQPLHQNSQGQLYWFFLAGSFFVVFVHSLFHFV